MNSLGEKLRKLREERQFPLRVVAAFLDLDQAILSKIERGLRPASREVVVKLADYYEVEEKELLVAWLSDKVLRELDGEDNAVEALQAAEEQMVYQTIPGRAEIIKSIQAIIKNDGRVAKAWLFGSVARGEQTASSDVDIMIEMNDNENYSFFDLIDIAFELEQKVNRKVDLVEKDCLKDFALKSAEADMIKIYG
jgi:predicted nucleotidyltransferase